MKRYLWMIMGLLIGCMLLGCGQTAKTMPEKDEVWIVAELPAGDELFAVGCDYGTAEKWYGFQGGSNADNSVLRDAPVFELGRQELPEDADLSTFRIRLSVWNEPGDFVEPIPVEGVLTFPVACGRIYRVAVDGDLEHGYVARLVGEQGES